MLERDRRIDPQNPTHRSPTIGKLLQPTAHLPVSHHFTPFIVTYTKVPSYLEGNFLAITFISHLLHGWEFVRHRSKGKPFSRTPNKVPQSRIFSSLRRRCDISMRAVALLGGLFVYGGPALSFFLARIGIRPLLLVLFLMRLINAFPHVLFSFD